jgi:hypothetical protein
VRLSKICQNYVISHEPPPKAHVALAGENLGHILPSDYWGRGQHLPVSDPAQTTNLARDSTQLE